MQSTGAGGVFEIEILDNRPGLLTFRAAGSGARTAFENESGGHRWQRIPPNEKRGRVHTSTVTVAVLKEPEPQELEIRDSEIEWQATRGSGPGGQNRNKVSSAVIMKHKPTGLTVRCETERSQGQNWKSALSLLRARLLEQKVSSAKTNENLARKQQVGCGARGDKTWTIRTQDGVVTDHKTGRKIQLRNYLKGEF